MTVSYPHTIENGRGLFPVQVAIGHILGKYRKYADAPEPVRRAP